MPPQVECTGHFAVKRLRVLPKVQSREIVARGNFKISCLFGDPRPPIGAFHLPVPLTRSLRTLLRTQDSALSTSLSPHPSVLALLVRLHEPQPLVHSARDLGHDVGAIGILELGHLLDADPDGPAESRQGV